ncbi:MAG TPA: hypothetical protein DCZ44_03590 [Flavobacteriaceae bacterium]|nr:hypothetical protein [Flavobacteriaceae bacterium]
MKHKRIITTAFTTIQSGEYAGFKGKNISVFKGMHKAEIARNYFFIAFVQVKNHCIFAPD